MPKIYYPTPDELQGARPLNEQLWFPQNQSLLVLLANTNEGRDLLCIDSWQQQPYPIVKMDKNFVRFYMGYENSRPMYKTDFRVGAKWANVIRHRWKDIRDALDRMLLEQILSWPPVYFKGRLLLPVGGGTSTSFYPDPDSEGSPTTVDGAVVRGGTNLTWADLRTGVGTAVNDSAASREITAYTSFVSERWSYFSRLIFLFNTSSIGGDVVDSATFEIVGVATEDAFDDSVSLVASSPASNTALVAADYIQLGGNSGTKQANDVDIDSMTFDSSTYTAWTLNSTGLNNITTDGITKFGLRGTLDNDSTDGPTWGADRGTRETFAMADTSSTSADPKLVVAHAAAFIPRAIMF